MTTNIGYDDTTAPAKNFQNNVRAWVEHCFGQAVADDIPTQCFRFFEEAGELVQALGMTKEDALKLVDYTWGRPKGEPLQELGGVMVTLAALATPVGMLMREAGQVELARCWLNVDKIRAKQASKKALGERPDPLPGSTAVGKWVTLLQAVPVAAAGGLERYLPQQSNWMIICDAGDSWIVEYPAPQDYTGQFQLPKTLCSAPRDTP